VLDRRHGPPFLSAERVASCDRHRRSLEHGYRLRPAVGARPTARHPAMRARGNSNQPRTRDVVYQTRLPPQDVPSCQGARTLCAQTCDSYVHSTTPIVTRADLLTDYAGAFSAASLRRSGTGRYRQRLFIICSGEVETIASLVSPAPRPDDSSRTRPTERGGGAEVAGRRRGRRGRRRLLSGLRSAQPAPAALLGAATARCRAGGCRPDGVRQICRGGVDVRFAAALVDIGRSQATGSPQATGCRRCERYRSDPFIFVAYPEVPPTDNAADRRRRPVAIARKIDGGTRSKPGSQTLMFLRSLVAT
jgi:hypothetical protein